MEALQHIGVRFLDGSGQDGPVTPAETTAGPGGADVRLTREPWEGWATG